MASTLGKNEDEFRTPSPKVTLPYINPSNENIIVSNRNDDHLDSNRKNTSNIPNDHIPQDVLANLIRLSTPPLNKDQLLASVKKKSTKVIKHYYKAELN